MHISGASPPCGIGCPSLKTTPSRMHRRWLGPYPRFRNKLIHVLPFEGFIWGAGGRERRRALLDMSEELDSKSRSARWEPPATAGLGPMPAWPTPDPAASARPLSPQGRVCLQRRVLLTSSQESGRCLWEKDRGVKMAPLPSLPPPGAGDPAADPTLAHASISAPCPLASLTSHFDGHSLLGADEVDDLLVGAGRDGVAIDPHNLIPYLGHRQRE